MNQLCGFYYFLLIGLFGHKAQKGVTTEEIVAGIKLFLFMDYGCCLRTAIMESMNMAQIQKELEICNMQPKTIALLIKTAYGCG